MYRNKGNAKQELLGELEANEKGNPLGQDGQSRTSGTISVEREGFRIRPAANAAVE